MSVSPAKSILHGSQSLKDDLDSLPSTMRSTSSSASYDQSEESDDILRDIKAVASIHMPTESTVRLYEVQPRQLGETEITFELDTPVELGSQCELILSATKQTPVIALGRIVSCMQMNEMTWGVTVRFHGPISKSQR